MNNFKLGKKSNFEKGSFIAYAYNSSCVSMPCGACNNCNASAPQATGVIVLTQGYL